MSEMMYGSTDEPTKSSATFPIEICARCGLPGARYAAGVDNRQYHKHCAMAVENETRQNRPLVPLSDTERPVCTESGQVVPPRPNLDRIEAFLRLPKPPPDAGVTVINFSPVDAPALVAYCRYLEAENAAFRNPPDGPIARIIRQMQELADDKAALIAENERLRELIAETDRGMLFFLNRGDKLNERAKAAEAENARLIREWDDYKAAATAEAAHADDTEKDNALLREMLAESERRAEKAKQNERDPQLSPEEARIRASQEIDKWLEWKKTEKHIDRIIEG